jgi:hypothetical protein
MTQASDSELARTAPKVKTVATTSHKVSQELDRIRESLLAPLLAPTRPKMKDLAPALDQLKKAAESTVKETDLLVEIPSGIAEGGNLKVEVVVTGAKGRGPVRRTLELDEAAKGGAEGWVVRLRLNPKKA